MGGPRAVPGRSRGGARRRCARARRRPVGAGCPRRARSRVGARGMKITALITAYNCERFIGEAVDSALAQDYSGPLEVLVIDDGSTDGTAAELAKRPAARVIRQPNAGYVAATERGVAEAEGELIALLAGAPDASAIRTVAKFDETTGDWVINGQKAWATNGGIADVHVVVASVDRELGSRGHAAFVIPPGTNGLEQGAKVKKHGIRASHTADVHLDDCRVPGSCLLGGKEKLDERLAKAREGKSAKGQAAMRTFELSRPTVGAQAVGIARAAYEYALDYAKEREAFGRKIVENQAIAFALADMKMEIDAARLLVHRAAWMGKTGKDFDAAEGSMSKLKAGEVAVWATERAIQILGGNGYSREFPVERMHRDAKIWTIFEGTSEIQRLVISRAISGMQIK